MKITAALLRKLSTTFLVLTSALAFNSVFAQSYPTKPIRIVTSGVAGAPDFAARLLAQEVSGPLGQSMVVENRGSGVISEQIVSQAAPDGYTLLVAATNHWTAPLLEKTPYDPVKEF
jgi:tripartite-type tricarboxylate transporter receptor subunit TctC